MSGNERDYESSAMKRLRERIAAIRPLDEAVMQQARERQNQLTKPPGSLGRLEELSIRLAGITGSLRPPLERKTVVVMAADHGVAAEGVSAYPQAVTAQMVANFIQGGAAINVLARRAGARVLVVDIGVATEIPLRAENFLQRKIAPGTRNLAAGPAMTWQEMADAIAVGLDIAEQEVARGMDILITGDMGIGNTTASSAIVAAVTGVPVEEVTGRGTGIDDSHLKQKIAIIERAIAVNQPNRNDPLDILAKLGGFEIAGLVGAIIGAASYRVPILVDGFISTAAALLAAELAPLACRYMIAAHSSVERGHRIMLEHLELQPLLNLDLRLGEGTGAVLALPLLENAVAILNEMATFEQAAVSREGNPATQPEPNR